jgi:hypothetical protein
MAPVVGGGASWARGRSRECLDAVMLWQRVQGSFDFSGLRFAYPAPLRMTILEVAIQHAAQFDQARGPGERNFLSARVLGESCQDPLEECFRVS